MCREGMSSGPVSHYTYEFTTNMILSINLDLLAFHPGWERIHKALALQEGLLIDNLTLGSSVLRVSLLIKTGYIIGETGLGHIRN